MDQSSFIDNAKKYFERECKTTISGKYCIFVGYPICGDFVKKFYWMNDIVQTKDLQTFIIDATKDHFKNYQDDINAILSKDLSYVLNKWYEFNNNNTYINFAIADQFFYFCSKENDELFSFPYDNKLQFDEEKYSIKFEDTLTISNLIDSQRCTKDNFYIIY
jgi:hypothetical protein